jgi:hypothetical protein
MVHDARIASLCREHGVTKLMSADRDFSRFPSLVVSNPLVADGRSGGLVMKTMNFHAKQQASRELVSKGMNRGKTGILTRRREVAKNAEENVLIPSG